MERKKKEPIIKKEEETAKNEGDDFKNSLAALLTRGKPKV